MEINQQELDTKIDAFTDGILSKSTTPLNQPKALEWLEAYFKLIDLEYKQIVVVSGMRDLSKHIPEDKRQRLNLQFLFRMAATSLFGQKTIDSAVLNDLTCDVTGVSLTDVCDAFKGSVENPIMELFYHTDDEDTIYVVDWPVEHHIVKNEDGTEALSNPDGAAILFVDGSAYYAINDLQVPKWLVETSAEDLTLKQILEIEDVDVRTVGLEKLGPEKAVDGLDPLDTCKKHDLVIYHLYNLGERLDDNDALFLYMTNPSTDEVHIEGVTEDCKTVQDALNMRTRRAEYGGDWNPCLIDGTAIDSGNTKQVSQGDVNLEAVGSIPEDAVRINNPFVLHPDNQKRHVYKGAELWGHKDQYDIQWLKMTAEKVTIEHPTHETPVMTKENFSSGIARVFPTQEYDPFKNVLRNVID